MTYEECLDYLYTQLPMYQREGKAAYKADLKNTIELCNYFGNPQKSFKSVHVAGTNGKGSVCHMLASVFQEAGYKVGLHTSPHLYDYRERIKVNGEMIPKEYVRAFVENNKAAVEHVQPSFFEWTVVLAFEYFKDEEVDIAIIETGMGGRLDSTNVIEPELSVITNIGFDHMQFLGNTLEEIAREKAGIIKAHTPVVIGQRHANTEGVFIEVSEMLNSPIYFASDSKDGGFQSDLKGPYQSENLQTALTAISQLRNADWKIDDEHVSRGLQNVKKNTGLKGRWQIVSGEPLILLDVAHNLEGIERVLDGIRSIPHQKLHIIWGMVNDKNTGNILKTLPHESTFYFCAPNIPRALSVRDLARVAKEVGLEGNEYSSVKEALHAAQTSAGNDDLIYVGGSTFVVAEVQLD